MSAARHTYRISGLDVASQIELPGAIPSREAGTPADVEVRLAPVPEALEGASERGPNWELAGDRFLLRAPSLGRYLVTGGHSIDVELAPGATAHDASGLVLGTSFGILLHQRGALVLHGAAVARGGSAIVICGTSGAGKSTLAAALCRAGCDFLADDLCVISLDGERRPVVTPDGRQLKLWRESVDQLALAGQQREAVREGFEKYFIEPLATAQGATRLAAIYVLEEAPPPGVCTIAPLRAPDAMRTLDVEAYRPTMRAKLGSKPAMLAGAAAVVRHALVFNLARPRGFEHVGGTVTALLESWGGLEP